MSIVQNINYKSKVYPTTTIKRYSQFTLKYKINSQNYKYYVLCCSIHKVSEEIKAKQDKKVLTGK